MKEQLITFETAKLAKEKGFDVPTTSYYNTQEPTIVVESGAFNFNYMRHGDVTVSAPTQSLLQKWLREVHNIETYVVRLPNVFVDEYGCPLYVGEILNDGSLLPTIDSTRTDIYESSFENTLLQALKLIEV